MPLSHILIASDFSKHAGFALQRAVALAKHNQAALDFVHVLTQSWMANLLRLPAQETQAKLLKAKQESEKKLFDLLSDETQSKSFKVAVLIGRAAEEIASYAKNNQCDLVIVGAHGEYYINDYVLGTTPASIVGQGNIPVLMIKKQPTVAYQRILIATDFSNASKKAVQFTFDCFPEASFQLLHVADVNYQRVFNVEISHPSLSDNSQTQEIWYKFDEFLNECQVDKTRFEKKMIGGYTADSVVRQAEKWKADLLAFGNQGHSKLHYLLMGSVAQRIMHLSRFDMLAVPASYASS